MTLFVCISGCFYDIFVCVLTTLLHIVTCKYMIVCICVYIYWFVLGMCIYMFAIIYICSLLFSCMCRCIFGCIYIYLFRCMCICVFVCLYLVSYFLARVVFVLLVLFNHFFWSMIACVRMCLCFSPSLLIFLFEITRVCLCVFACVGV